MEITEEIFQLVKKKMKEQGAYDHEAYAEFVDETIDYFLEKGKLEDEANLEFIKQQLLDMWERMANKLAS